MLFIHYNKFSFKIEFDLTYVIFHFNNQENLTYIIAFNFPFIFRQRKIIHSHSQRQLFTLDYRSVVSYTCTHYFKVVYESLHYT